MKPHQFLGTALMVGSLAGSLPRLQQRRHWDAQNRTISLCVDYDDCVEISMRSGVPLSDLLHHLWHDGASHIAITELTLGDLLASGQLSVALPAVAETAPTHRWLTSLDTRWLTQVSQELSARIPALPVRLLEIDGRSYVQIDADLRALAGLTVGFDPQAFAQAQAAGLEPVARPRHLVWPPADAIERSLAQAAELGARLVAFAGNYVLGHEMFMQATIASLQQHDLTPVFFAESRHQKGDWFIAKARLPNVVIGHEFTPPELDMEDEHGMAHRWGRMADRGVRFFSLRAMRGVHATEPLSLRGYIGMVLTELIHERGLRLAGRPDFRPMAHTHLHGHDHAADTQTQPDEHGHAHQHEHESAEHGHEHPAGTHTPQGERDHTHQHQQQHESAEHGHEHDHHPEEHDIASNLRAENQLSALALAAAGAASMAVAGALDLPEPWALLLTVAGGAAAWSLTPLLDRPRSHLEERFPPSYAPKAIALSVATAAPVAALAVTGLLGSKATPGLDGLLLAALIEGAGAAALAATVADVPYTLRVEEFRSLNLDWALPLGLTVGRLIGGRPGTADRQATLAGLAGASLAAAAAFGLGKAGLLPADLVGRWAAVPMLTHTHHLSALQARLGDLQLALNPQPLSKWGWLLPAGLALAHLGRGQADALPLPLRTGATLLAALGSMALLAPFRQGGVPLTDTLAAAVQGLTLARIKRTGGD
ncbi:MAG: DUF5693 family protein [Anaerolineae bacterium]